MKITKVFTYNEGPWYKPLDAMHHMGHRDGMVEDLAVKASEYSFRRLFALQDLKDGQLDDNAFLGLLTESFTIMARSLVDQFLAWTANNRRKIKSITIINNQGIPKPGYIAILQELLAVEGTAFYQLIGMNCASTPLAIQHLYQLRKIDPLEKEECDLLFSIEVPSATLRRNRPVLPFHYFIYDMVIADGGGLAVIESTANGPGLEILGHDNFLYPKSQASLISRAIGNQIEHGVSPEVIEDIRPTIKPSITRALAQLGLDQNMIKHWIMHPGGVIIINCVCDALGMPNTTMQHGLDTVRSQGNSMSSLLLYVLRRYFESEAFHEQDYAMLIGFGPGFEIETITTRYM